MLLLIIAMVLSGCSGGGSSGGTPTVTETVSGAPLERERLIRWDLQVADLDADGMLEVIVAETVLDGAPPHGGYLTVYRQLAPREFARGVTYGTPPEAHSVGIADMDADGFPDVLVGSHVSEPGAIVDRLTFFRHTGSGITLTESGHTELPLVLQDIALADLNEDGLPDVVVTGGHSTLVLWNDPDRPGSLRAGQIIDQAASSVALGDLDGDGRIDLVLNRGTTETSLSVYLLEDDWFVLWGELSVTQARDVLIADFDGDRLADIVVSSGVTPAGDAPWPTVNLLLQQSDAGARLAFHQPVSTVADRSPSDFTSAMALADFDGDGRTDVAMIASHANRQRRNGIYNYVERRSNIAVLLQSEVGSSFGPPALQLIADGVWDLAAGDLDGDGSPDVVLSGGSMTALFNDGNGRLGLPSVIAE